MKKIIFIFLLALLIPIKAAAQEDVRFSSVLVELLPEYDDPDMLVIYHIALSEGLSFPIDVDVRIPNSGRIHAVAVGPDDESLVYATYNQRSEGNWTVLTIQINMLDTRTIQVDFYDPQLKKDGAQRDYMFSWLGDYPVDNMRVIVHQPINATQFQVEPDLGTFVTQDNNIPYYLLDVGAPAAGDDISFQVSYQKTDDALTIENLQVEPSVPIAASDPGSLEMMSILPWFLGVLGVLLLVGGGFWYWQTGRKTATSSRLKQRGARSRAGKQANSTSGEGTYCHQCGKRAGSGDRFCRSCGTKLRAE